MKPKRFGFTIVELLTVIAIIAMLIGVLIPTLTMIKNKAKITQQQAHFNTIEMAIMAFKNDFGDYPPSVTPSGWDVGYTGAQLLTEALLGWDLMGFHPDSDWMPDGWNFNDTNDIYQSTFPSGPGDTNLEQRKGPYLELSKANVFKVRSSTPGTSEALYDAAAGISLAPDTYVLCDVFAVKKILVRDETKKAGTPILYYKANTSSKTIEATPLNNNIYNALDNFALITESPILTRETPPEYHPLGNAGGAYNFFYEYITDKNIPQTVRPWPYRADSYLLISAGPDGEYGTNDDVTNFK